MKKYNLQLKNIRDIKKYDAHHLFNNKKIFQQLTSFPYLPFLLPRDLEGYEIIDKGIQSLSPLCSGLKTIWDKCICKSLLSEGYLVAVQYIKCILISVHLGRCPYHRKSPS